MKDFKQEKKIYKKIKKLYAKRKKSLVKKMQSTDKEVITSMLANLKKFIKNKEKENAVDLSLKLKEKANVVLKRNLFEKIIDNTASIIIALSIAIIVRQMWFEPYVIPSGSMRPTLKERDLLVVAKDTYSLNVPLMLKHFYFNNDLIKRGNIVVFSSAEMDIKDNSTLYFYLIPGKKQFVKRLIGKPGDTLYFYGGKIYGIDKNGDEIEDFQKDPWFKTLEHIPFIRFEGNPTFTKSNNYIYSTVTLYQYNEPIAKLFLDNNNVKGKMIKQAPDYFDIFGFKNFATSRIITKEQAKDWYNAEDTNNFFLELTHHPSIKPPSIHLENNIILPSLSYSYSIIGLDQEHLNRISSSISTARFIVKNKKAYRVGANPLYAIDLDIPNGCYEILNGIAQQIYLLGISKTLPKTHPIYSKNPSQIQTLYNLGIEFNKYFSPSVKNQLLTPSRFAYFKNEDLYLCNKAIFDKEEAILKEFKAKSTFIDSPPFNSEGTLNKELIKKYGLQVPDNQYLVLGDNYAMSSDSRDFGFVPQQNLKGTARLIFWPPSRTSLLSQPKTPLFTLPKLFIYGIFVIILITLYILAQKKRKINS